MAKKKNDIEAKVEEVAESTPVEAPEKVDEKPEEVAEIVPEEKPVVEAPVVEQPKPVVEPVKPKEVANPVKAPKKSGKISVVTSGSVDDSRIFAKLVRIGFKPEDIVTIEGFYGFTGISDEKTANEIAKVVNAIGYKVRIIQ